MTFDREDLPSICLGVAAAFALLAWMWYYPGSEGQPTERPKRPAEQSLARPGNTVLTKRADLCMDTETGFDEMTKWSVRGDREEVARAILKHGGQLVPTGQSVKILDIGIMRARVRVLDAGERECWVPTETVR